MADKYEIRRFRAVEKGEPGYAKGTDWIQAVGFGFHDTRRNDEFVDKIMAMYRSDDRELTGAYQTGDVAPHSLAGNVPVATFGTLRKDLNVGYGRQLRTHMVTAVTVRGTHRRRGLLRRMMTEDLSAAKADGMAIAALTASEGSIYGRFGYGVATFERSVKVDTGPRFGLRHVPSGTVEIADRKVLLELAPEVFERVHRHTPGSIVRQDAYRQNVSGTVGREGKEDEAIRCALHYDADGTVDGYVSYKFAGWDTKPYLSPWKSWTSWRRPTRRIWSSGSSSAASTSSSVSAGLMPPWTIRWSGRYRTRAALRRRTTGTCSGSGSLTAPVPWVRGAIRPTERWYSLLRTPSASRAERSWLTSKAARQVSRRLLRTRGRTFRWTWPTSPPYTSAPCVP